MSTNVDIPFSNKLDDQQKKALNDCISKKLATISPSYSDGVLSEYVTVMVTNRKNRQEICSELVTFLGSELAEQFSIWLWEELQHFATNGTFRIDQEYQSNTNQNGSSHARPSSVISIRNRNFDNGDDDIDMKESRESRPSTGATPRLLLSAVHKANESTKNIKPRPEPSMDMDSEETNNNNNNRRDNRRKLKGKSHKGSAVPVLHKREEGKVEFTISFDGESKAKKRNGNEKNSDDFVSKDISYGKSKKVKKERCSFWPNCQKGDSCIYHHPSEPCKNFPGCPFGEQCLYIHPSVNCKYGTNCTRANCAYHHPPAAAVAKVPIPCKFGKFCTKGPACPFLHAPKASRWAGLAASGAPSAIPCKFGEGCMFKLTTCKFAHPDDTTTMQEVSNLSDSLPKTPPREATTENNEELDVDDIDIEGETVTA